MREGPNLALLCYFMKNTAILLGIGLGLIIVRMLKPKNKIIKVSYSVPPGTPNPADALHSFERRKSDGFGGKMLSKIREELNKMFIKGIKPEVKNIDIQVNSKTLTVNWSAEIGPSTDGKAYLGIMSFGSAGTGADERAKGQFEGMKKRTGGKNFQLVKDFINKEGIYIRQYFYKYEL